MIAAATESEHLVAFHGSQKEKDAILEQLQQHAAADEITKGIYWENGRGCAVGCTIHGRDRALYEPRFGIPRMLAHLEDTIHEGLPLASAKTWPISFMQAIEPGVNLSYVGWQFLHQLLTDETLNPGISHPIVKQAVADVAALVALLAKGGSVDESAARNAADAAARVTRVATDLTAARAAEAASNIAESAAKSAASAAWRAARAARNAAKSAGASAISAAASDWSIAAAYVSMSNVLIQLLEATRTQKETA